jgi:micrococcal nuclease
VRRSSLPGLLALVALAGLVAITLAVGLRVVREPVAPLDDDPSASAPGDGAPRDGAPGSGVPGAGTPGATGLGGEGRTTPPGVPDDAEPATIVRIVDGDTIRIHERGGGTEAVRLLNVDAPELDHPDHGRECGAGTATGLVRDLLPVGATVWLAGDREDRDRFDRLLRYAWTAAGVDVQAALVEAGLAEVLVIAPNDRFVAELRPLERAAREDGAGVWGPGCLE